MHSYVGLNRRKGGERRVWNVGMANDHRGADRRQHGVDTYYLVFGHGGIDRISVVCLIAMALIVLIVAS